MPLLEKHDISKTSLFCKNLNYTASGHGAGKQINIAGMCKFGGEP
jgi:hypothetical protein